MRRAVLQAAGIAAFLVWSAGPSRAALVVNEIMYNSRETPDVEYIEIYNSGTVAVDMTGWYLLDDNITHRKCYLSGTLQPGAYWVVAGVLTSFTVKYPWVTNLNPNEFDSADGLTGWSLANSGDEVRLYNAGNTLLNYVRFTDQPPWPTAPDGTGPSLELYNPALDNNLPTSWGASVSTAQDGTPGERNSIYREDQPPRIEATARSVALPGSVDTVVVSARATDDEGVPDVDLYVDDGGGYLPRPMYDDGFHGDGGANDNIFGASIAPHATGTIVRYYVSASDSLLQTTLDPAAFPTEHYGYTVGYRPPNVVINEVLARNVSGIVDEAGQYEDWLELKNREPFGVNLSGFYLTDKAMLPRMWKIPEGTVIPGGGWLYVWCDSDVNQGTLHANFKLGADGGYIGLYDTMDHGNVPVEEMTYGITGADIAFGFRPEDADAREYLATPTPGASNATSSLFSAICINEFLTSSAQGGIDDWVEIYNRGGTDVDVGGWRISDGTKICGGGSNEYMIPYGTIIPSGGFWVVDEAALGFGFDINGGDLIQLTHSDCVTGQDYFDHGPEYPDVTHGRLPNGMPYWRFFDVASPGTANECAEGGASLAPVTGLRFTSKIEFTWDTVMGAEDYDVVKGLVGLLRVSGGNFAAAGITCIENDDLEARSWDAAVPPEGPGYFYLIRAATFHCDMGTYDTGAASQAGSRDGEIDVAPGTCP